MSHSIDYLISQPTENKSSKSSSSQSINHLIGEQTETQSPEAEKNAFQRGATTVAQSAPVQAGLGVAKRWTWYADLFKELAVAAGQDELRQQMNEAAIEGKPLNKEVAERQLEKYAEWIPTQGMIEREFSKGTGIDLAPKGKIAKGSRLVGELAGFRNINGRWVSPAGKTGKEALKEIAKQTGKHLRAGAVGAGAQVGLEAAGVPAPIAGAVGLGVSNIPGMRRTLAKVAPEAQEARNIAQKHNLPQFAGVEIENAPKAATASEAKIAESRESLRSAQEKAVAEAVDRHMPAAQMEKNGIDLDDAVSTAYKDAYETASQFEATAGGQAKISTAPIVESIDQEIARIKGRGVTLTEADKQAVKLLEQKKAALKKAGHITPTQAMQEFQGYNADAASIYAKPEFAGSQRTIAKTYGFLKDQMVKGVRGINAKLASGFEYANDLFARRADLNKVRGMFEKYFGNGFDQKGLQKLLGNKSNVQWLERTLGKEGLQELKDIAKYGRLAEARVFSRLKPTKGGIAQVINDYGLAGLFALKHKLLGGIWGFPKYVSNQIAKVRGALLLKPGPRKAYSDYLKAVASGKEAAIQKASSDFDRVAQEELGDKEKIRRMIGAED